MIPTTLSSKYNIIDQISSTRKSNVYLIEKNKKKLICKQVKIIENKVDIENELTVLNRMKYNPRIIRLEDKLEDIENVYMILEYGSKGTVSSSFYKEDDKKNEEKIKKMVKESMLCLLECHKVNLIHGDIKYNNFILDDNNHMKLIDFGCSRYVEDELQVLDFKTGTPFHMSPENIEGKQCIKSDVWALGISIYYLLTNQHPFAKITDFSESLWNSILNHDMNMQDISGYSNKFRSFLIKLLEKDPIKRISIIDAMSDPFIH